MNITESNKQYHLWARRNGFWAKNIGECEPRQVEEMHFRSRLSDAIGERVLMGTHVTKHVYDAVMNNFKNVKISPEQDRELLRIFSDSIPDSEINFNLLSVFNIKPL